MKPLRTAIIGCGHFAQQHAERLITLETIHLVGFCNRNIEKAITFNQQYADGRGEVYEDYERMFAELDLDLVYICLPPFAHGNEVELACSHGVHFFIEKPIALTLELAQTMVEQTKRSGIKSQVGFMYRHGEAALWLKQYIDSTNATGRALMAAEYFCNSLHSWWWRDRSKSGGQLVEQVIHLLDLARFFLGEPVHVYSMQENLFHRDIQDYTVEDASGTIVRFDSGGIAVFVASNGAIPGRWDYDLKVILPDLTVHFEDLNCATLHHTREKWGCVTEIDSRKDLYLAETLDLLAAICEDRPTSVPIEEGFRSLRLALAAAHSAKQGKPITIPLSP